MFWKDPKVKKFDGKLKDNFRTESELFDPPTVSPTRSGGKFAVKSPKDLVVGKLYQAYHRDNKKGFIYQIENLPYCKNGSYVVDVLRISDSADKPKEETIYLSDYSIISYGAKKWSFNYLVRLF